MEWQALEHAIGVPLDTFRIRTEERALAVLLDTELKKWARQSVKYVCLALSRTIQGNQPVRRPLLANTPLDTTQPLPMIAQQEHLHQQQA